MTDHSCTNGKRSDLTRRTVLGVGAGLAAASLVPLRLDAQEQVPIRAPESGPTTHISFEVNGERVTMDVDACASRLDLLRDRLALTETKKEGVKGMGDLVMVGSAPAIANATYHATGNRIRKPHIRIEDVL
jgi:hypothetical protein